MDRLSTGQLEETIGYTFFDKTLLKRALTHPSYANEQKINKIGHYERLEFLGDAVLEMISSEYLYQNYEHLSEGKMTKIRAAAVCEEALAFCGEKIKLGDYIFLGKGEQATGGKKRQSTVADIMEAILGAIYLDGGLENAKVFALKFILKDIDKKGEEFDSKTTLQEIVQHRKLGTIQYVLLEEKGPEHAKEFVCGVLIDQKQCGIGRGKNKKDAEQKAAYEALQKFKQ